MSHKVKRSQTEVQNYFHSFKNNGTKIYSREDVEFCFKMGGIFGNGKVFMKKEN